jgi:hypothetical protein
MQFQAAEFEVMQFPNYSHKKRQKLKYFFETRDEFFTCGSESQLRQGGRIILLGNNTGSKWSCCEGSVCWSLYFNWTLF